MDDPRPEKVAVVDEVRERLSSANAALQTSAGLLQALPRNLAYGLQALIDKQGGVPEAPAPEAPAPEPTEQLEGAEQLEAAAPEAAADVADEAPTSDAGESPVDTEPAPEPQEDQ